ncbi:unnamed protein product [Paramecium primaurelia]|uniref:Uncharacterized protein n=1 Tax=Paramecium primaurelia TaxID=5886 RepID=A0A8S1QGX5_PARPR|nr:unnamed protein product [Paramecium primaurelia]
MSDQPKKLNQYKKNGEILQYLATVLEVDIVDYIKFQLISSEEFEIIQVKEKIQLLKQLSAYIPLFQF